MIFLGALGAAESANPPPDYTGELFTLAGVALLAMLGWVGTLIVKRVKGRASEPEMWKRLDELSFEVYGGRDEKGEEQPGLKVRVEQAERRDRVKGYIIRSLAKQWPADHVPHLDPGYLSEIDEDTIPADSRWRQKP